MSNVPILFLDFDGVLHPDFARGKGFFSALPLLWQLLDECPHVDVVFSSSWGDIHPVEDMIDFVTSGGGEHLSHRFLGGTPRAAKEAGANLRETEIMLWLRGNGQTHRDWLALDDCEEYFSPGCPNLFWIDHITGLTPEHMESLIARCQA